MLRLMFYFNFTQVNISAVVTEDSIKFKVFPNIYKLCAYKYTYLFIYLFSIKIQAWAKICINHCSLGSPVIQIHKMIILGVKKISRSSCSLAASGVLQQWGCTCNVKSAGFEGWRGFSQPKAANSLVWCICSNLLLKVHTSASLSLNIFF